MDDHRKRLDNEYSVLKIKINKLKVFIISETYNGLPAIDKLDLKEQLKHMQGYFKILYKRIARQCNNT